MYENKEQLNHSRSIQYRNCEKYNCTGEFFIPKDKEPSKFVCGKCGKEIEMLIEN